MLSNYDHHIIKEKNQPKQSEIEYPKQYLCFWKHALSDAL